MNLRPCTQQADGASIHQQAANGGLSVLALDAFDMGVRRPRPCHSTAESVTPHACPADDSIIKPFDPAGSLTRVGGVFRRLRVIAA